jgi:hypothetical protein
MKAENRLLVKNVPGPRCPAEARGGNRIEKIVRRNDGDAQDGQYARGQMHQRRPRLANSLPARQKKPRQGFPR